MTRNIVATDGVWQVAPLVSRYEVPTNVSLSPGDTWLDHYDGDAIQFIGLIRMRASIMERY